MPICKNPHCGKDHPSHIRCDAWARMNAGGGLSRLAPSGTETEPINGNVKPRGLREQEAQPPAIKQAKEFIKRVGRPKVYPDRKTQMREVMRRKRERERAKVAKV